jgi:hypothetical protein
MTIRLANMKKFAIVAAMATIVTATGWVLAAGTAQAAPKPHPHPNTVTQQQQRLDNFADRFYGEGTPVDRFADLFFPGVK